MIHFVPLLFVTYTPVAYYCLRSLQTHVSFHLNTSLTFVRATTAQLRQHLLRAQEGTIAHLDQVDILLALLVTTVHLGPRRTSDVLRGDILLLTAARVQTALAGSTRTMALSPAARVALG